MRSSTTQTGILTYTSGLYTCSAFGIALENFDAETGKCLDDSKSIDYHLVDVSKTSTLRQIENDLKNSQKYSSVRVAIRTGDSEDAPLYDEDIEAVRDLCRQYGANIEIDDTVEEEAADEILGTYKNQDNTIQFKTKLWGAPPS